MTASGQVAAVGRVGIGWDQHRLAAGRPLVLAGVAIPHDKGLAGHSDGDVVLHAVIDAMLGAAGLDDIGQQFPDSDPAYAGIASGELVGRAAALLGAAGLRVAQADTVIAAERPKLADHKPAMRASLARLLGLPVGLVNVKAKTAEGLGPVGAGEAMACYAVVLLAPADAAAPPAEA